MSFPIISKLKPGKAFFQTILFLVIVFFVSCLPLFLAYFLKNVNPAEYGLIRGQKEDLEITYKETLFFASLVFSFFVLSVSLRYVQKHKLKLLLMWCASLYLFAAGLFILTDIIYYQIFACRITFSAVQTVLNTNPEEMKGFMKLYYSPGMGSALAVFVALVPAVIFKRAWFITLFSKRSFFITSLLLTLLGIIDFGQMAHSKGNGLHNVRYWDIIIGEYNEYNAFNKRLKAEKNNQAVSKEYDHFYKQDTLTKTLVLVISESLSKRHMSFYGYARNTTPHLDTNTSLFKFTNCVTQAALTIEAVPGLFFNGYLSKKINLITLCKKLGYETSWISNQSGWGKGDGSIVLLSQLCKNSVFTDQMADNDKSNSSLHYDEEVLHYFNKELNAPCRASKFIVLHLMGCHFDYEKRYPASRNFFTSAPPSKTILSNMQTRTILNSYDNAMRYHDSIINEVVRIFSKHSVDKTAALLFLSDHGEELYEYRNHAGHGYPPTPASSEIPYFTILSPNFKKNYPDITTTMEKRLNTPYNTADNFYTLIHLLNIGSKKYRNKILRNSFFSPAYDSLKPRFVMGMDYDKMSS